MQDIKADSRELATQEGAGPEPGDSPWAQNSRLCAKAPCVPKCLALGDRSQNLLKKTKFSCLNSGFLTRIAVSQDNK